MEKLLQEVKEHLHITWNHEDGGLTRFLKSGKSHFKKLIGVDVDFEDEDNKTLLFEYCRYARSNSLEYFDMNYLSEIINLQLKEGIKANEEDSQDI